MGELINFFVRNHVFFIFILFEFLCFYILGTQNSYHRASAMSSSNAISGALYKVTNSISDYAGLKDVNKELANENARLREYLTNKELSFINRVDTLVDSVYVTIDSVLAKGYVYTSAKVINNTTHSLYNYITLDKGSKDGFKKDMGLVSTNGVVGIIKTVSKNYSSAMSLINKNIKLTAKIRHKKFTGSISWNGESAQYGQLDEIPNHANIEISDTITTSGYSAIFPENFMIGTIEDFELKEGSNFYDIKVKLATDFYTLRYVDGVENLNRSELIELEELAIKR